MGSFMEMPVPCRCGEWFELHDGYSSKFDDTTICEKCHEKQVIIKDIKDEIEELEIDISNGINRRENKKLLRKAKAELEKAENNY